MDSVGQLDPLSVWWGLKSGADGKSPGFARLAGAPSGHYSLGVRAPSEDQIMVIAEVYFPRPQKSAPAPWSDTNS
jgi:hypothetical protein